MKKCLGILVSLIMLASWCFTLVGCNKKIPDNESTLEIYAIEAGFGVEWLHELAKAFEAENPDVDVRIWSEKGVERASLMLQAGPKSTTADLLFTQEILRDLIDKGKNAMKGYDNIAEDLTELYQTVIPGESLTIEQKLMPTFAENMKTEAEENGVWKDKYYLYSWGNSLGGFVYDELKFEELHLTEPKTTDALIEMADGVKSSIAPFVSSMSTGYWNTMAQTWWAEYETNEEYSKFWTPTRPSDYANFEQKGRLYGLQVVDQLLNPKYGRSHKNTVDFPFAEAQAKIITGEALIAPAGSWFENEMSLTIKEAKDDGIDFQPKIMQTPIISAISQKLSYWDENDDYDGLYLAARDSNDSSAKQKLLAADEKLQEIVRYVDKDITQMPAGVTQDDVDIVAKARKVYVAGGQKMTSIIPSYSNAKHHAKSFLQFMSTNRGIEIYAKYAGGSQLPFQYNYTDTDVYKGFSKFTQRCYDLLNVSECGVFHATSSGAWKVKVNAYASGLGPNSFIKTGADYKTPEYAFDYAIITENEFRNLLVNAGLL